MAQVRWDAEGLSRQLNARLPGARVEVLASCTSTNTLLIERARAGDTSPCLLVAEEQTAGRGRLGRSWQAAPGSALTCSLALPYAPADWQGLSLAVGVALADALEPEPKRLRIKWPNDLWLVDAPGADPGTGRKLCGILIETVAARDLRVAVIGFGINVLPQPVLEGMPPRACWQEIEPEASAPLALERVLQPLAAMLRQFELGGFAPMAEAFARRDLLRGHAVRMTQAASGDGAEGQAEGVDARGALRVRTAAGLQLITSGEVSVRPTLSNTAPLAAPGAV